MTRVQELYSQGKYSEAIPIAEEAIQVAERSFGPDDPKLAASLVNLALLYNNQGRYAEAEPLLRRCLAINEKVLGAEHPVVATLLGNLAVLYDKQGRYAEAEPLLLRALRIDEKALGTEHPAVATDLNNLALLYHQGIVAADLNNLAALYDKLGKYAEAEPLLQRALLIQEKALGPEHPDVATALNSLAESYRKQGKYVKAEPLYQRALRIREKSLGSEHPDVALSLNNLGELYRQQGRYPEAEPFNQRALRIWEKALGPEHPAVALSLNNLAALYDDQGKYGEAEPLYQRALRIREKALGPEHPDVALSLNNLAVLYEKQGRYAEAEPLYQRALRIQEKVLGPEHPLVALSLQNLGRVLLDEGKLAEAEPLYQRALGIYEKALGPEHPAVAKSLGALGELYSIQGKYAEAEPLYQRALGIQEKALGPEHPDVATALNHLAGLYELQGKYPKVEALYQRALRIQEKALGPEHPDVGSSLNSLAGLYRAQGKYAEAEPLYQRALRIQEKALGTDAPEVAADLYFLAELYRTLHKYAEAEPFYQRALRIMEEAVGQGHPAWAGALNSLAQLYAEQGKYTEAEPLYQRAVPLLEKTMGPEHPALAAVLNNQALLFYNEGRFDDAEALYHRALSIQEKALGPEHPAVANSLNNLAAVYYARQAPEQAQPLFARSFDILFQQFQYHFTYMSEKERLGFLNTVAYRFPFYFSFVQQFREKNPDLVGRMYDLVLWQKGFVAGSVAALRRQIEASGNPEALRLLEQLSSKRTQVATQLNAQPADRGQWLKNIEQLETEANELERALVARSSQFAEQKKLERVTWRDVQEELKPGEAAVEVVKFQFFDGKKWTDKTYYVALIVTRETTTAPTLVLLGEAKDLEAEPLKDYRQLVQQRAPPEAGSSPAPSAATSALGAKFYAAFWQPLEKPLAGARRVYLSPDGMLNPVSWAVLSSPDGKALSDKYDLRLVSSTKDLLRQPHAPGSQVAVLVGNPRFDLTEAQQEIAARGFHKKEEPTLVASASPGAGLRSREQESGTLPPLPGTQAEVEAIQGLLKTHNWKTETYTGASALEEAVKQVERPRVLHLATHGFFLSDQKVKLQERSGLGGEAPAGMEDPMLRSGLFFAGAERTLAGTPRPPELDDGVLTAYEATGLNLQGTELVVLSACDTGLGKVEAGEGVFGLRRALQVAGAESVMMSMWSVPDRETQELMALFYQKWLGGEDKHQALREAQQEMREKVKARYGRDLPFYWGAFVLVGR